MRQPKKAEKELIELAQARFESAKSAIAEKYDLWMERLAFLRGFHYHVRDGSYWSDLDEPTGEERDPRNYIRTFVRASVAVRMRAFPNPSVPAATNDMKAMQRAAAAEKVVRSFVDDGVLGPDHYIKLLYWVQTVGGGWLKHYWDFNAGRLITNTEKFKETTETDPETGEEFTSLAPELDEFGEAIFENEFEGKIVTEFVDTVDGLPDPTARTTKEMRYWIHRKLRPVDELEKLYPEDYFGNKTKGRFSKDRDESAQEKDELSGTVESGSADDDLATVLEYWEPASRYRPNGALVIWCGGVILYVGSNILRPARIPAVLYVGDNPTPAGLYADGVVEDLIPIQKTINLVESKKKEWLRKALNPHVLNPHGSMIDGDQFGEVIGQVINYAPGLKPSIMEVAPIPASVSGMTVDLVSQMKEISTYSDISRGDVPTGVESGRAIAFLRENEQSIREPDMMNHKLSCLESLKHCFWLAKQFMPDGRLLRVLGEEGYNHFEFKNAELDWDIDLAPEVLSGAPTSRALRWAETMEAFDKGVFDDERPGAKQVRRMLSMDTAASSTIDPNSHHKNLAKLENSQMMQIISSGVGSINPVREFHDDYEHLEIHNALRCSPEYLEWPQEMQQMFDAHCEEHNRQMEIKKGIYAQDNMALGTPTSAPEPGMNPLINPGEPQPQPQNNLVQEEGFDKLH